MFVGVIHLFDDLWKMLFFKKGFNLKLVLLFGVPGILVSYFSSSIPLTLNADLLKRMLGAFLFAYSLLIFLKPKWQLRSTNSSAVVGGALSGFFAGVFGVGGAVRSAFLSSFNLPKDMFIFTSGAIALLIDSSRVFGYYQGDVLLKDFSVYLLIISVVISVFGAYLAKRFVNKVPQKLFRYIVGAGLFAVSILLFLGI